MKSKFKPLALISNDWHLKDDNIEQVWNLMTQKAKVAKTMEIKTLIILGDVFHSRKAQSQRVLNAFRTIIKDILTYQGREVYCIAGNHDKVDGTTEQSFLTPFMDIPNFHLIEEWSKFSLENLHFLAIPYFTEEEWIRHYNESKSYGNVVLNKYAMPRKDILLTHMAFDGSVNNNKMTQQSERLNQKFFEDYGLVLSGHYHNCHQVYQNTYHLPSICQNNFGEDDRKGFTVLYNDGSFDLVQSKFDKYLTWVWNTPVNNVTDIIRCYAEYLHDNDDHYAHLRVQLKGTKTELEALDISELKEAGFKVEKIATDVERTEINQEIITIDHKSMIDKFEDFCDLHKIDFEEGVKYLKDWVV